MVRILWENHGFDYPSLTRAVEKAMGIAMNYHLLESSELYESGLELLGEIDDAGGCIDPTPEN